MDRHNENDDMHMKDTQNTEAQEEACAGAEAGDAGDAVQTLPENLGAGLWNEVLLVPHQYFEARCLEELGRGDEARALYDHILILKD